MAPPDVTQEAEADEVAAIERLRQQIAEERDSRARSEADAVRETTVAQLRAERVRLEAELAAEQELTRRQVSANSSFGDAREAMRQAEEQQAMLAAGQKVEEANQAEVDKRAEAAGETAEEQHKAAMASAKEAEKSAKLVGTERSTADVDQSDAKPAGSARTTGKDK